MVLEMPTSSQRREALEILPTDLYGSFQGIITRIRERPSASAKLGMQVLMWLHFALRPLKLAELQHALAVKKGHIEFDWGNIPSQKALLDCCLGLVIVDEETWTVRFVHYTLEEYFRDNARTEFPEGYSSIAESCLTYLNSSQLRQHCTDLDCLQKNIIKYPFLNYAALNWGIYTKQQCSDGVTQLVRMLVEHENERPPSAVQALYLLIYPGYWRWDGVGVITKRFSGIHAAAYFGLSEIVANFCEVEIKDDANRTPLSWAAEFGHEAAVRLLLERDGVDTNSRDNLNYHGKTPLIWAAERGHEAVVWLLLQRVDVDINSRDKYLGKSALLWAAEKGHEAVVQLLLERVDVDINSGDEYLERSALRWAAERGHEAVVRLLLERVDVDINSRDSYWGMTAFMCAAATGQEAIVRLLLLRGDIDIDARDSCENTPLILAASKGHEAIVRLLLERGDIDINDKDRWGHTPLISAAKEGHEATVRLLLEREDIDINAQNNEGKTPLMYATQRGYEAIVQLLLERQDIDINAKDNEGKTSLTWATEEGHEAIIRLLDKCDVPASDPDIAPDGSLPGVVAGVEAEDVSGSTTT